MKKNVTRESCSCDNHYFLVVDRHSDREPLDEYISKKREMFLVQVITFLFG